MERGGFGRLLTFSAFRMGANSRLGAYSNKYGIPFFHVTIFPQCTIIALTFGI